MHLPLLAYGQLHASPTPHEAHVPLALAGSTLVTFNPKRDGHLLVGYMPTVMVEATPTAVAVGRRLTGIGFTTFGIGYDFDLQGATEYRYEPKYCGLALQRLVRHVEAREHGREEPHPMALVVADISDIDRNRITPNDGPWEGPGSYASSLLEDIASRGPKVGVHCVVSWSNQGVRMEQHPTLALVETPHQGVSSHPDGDWSIAYDSITKVTIESCDLLSPDDIAQGWH